MKHATYTFIPTASGYNILVNGKQSQEIVCNKHEAHLLALYLNENKIHYSGVNEVLADLRA